MIDEDERRAFVQKLEDVADYCRRDGRNDYAVWLEEVRDFVR